jgi:hypothetical protein
LRAFKNYKGKKQLTKEKKIRRINVKLPKETTTYILIE